MSKSRDLANAGTALTSVSATELGYLDGVTSAVQTQIDNKIGSASAINPTIVDAKGDLIVATAADTVARLAVGTNDQVLTADSTTATGLKWAAAGGGGMTVIASGSLSGTTTTISSISGSYIHLYLVILSPYLNTSGSPLKITWNGTTSGTYAFIRAFDGGGNTAWNSGTAQTGLTISGTNMETYSIARCYSMMIQNYTTSNYHRAIGNMTDDNTSGGATMFGQNSAITSAITSIGITTNNGTSTFAGGTYTLYGVK